MSPHAGGDDGHGDGGDDDRRGRLRRRAVSSAGCSSPLEGAPFLGTGTSSRRNCRGRRRGHLEGADPPADDAALVRSRPGDGAVATSAGPTPRARAAADGAAVAATGQADDWRLSGRTPPASADAHTRRCPRGGDTSDRVGEVAPLTGPTNRSPGRPGEEEVTAVKYGPEADGGGPVPAAPGSNDGMTAVDGSAADAPCEGVVDTAAGESGCVCGAGRIRRRGCCRDGDEMAFVAGPAPVVAGATGVGGSGRVATG